MDFNSTVKGSLLEGFDPEGWDFEKIDKCCSNILIIVAWIASQTAMWIHYKNVL